MIKCPCSAYREAGGMLYFPRMLDKMRLYARGELRPDFHENLGKGADAWCCRFLRIDYEALKSRVLETESTDEELLEWCFQQGHRLNKTDLMVWNEFVRKLGWNDLASDRLKQLKAESGLGDRDDIQTMAEYFEADEGRKPGSQ